MSEPALFVRDGDRLLPDAMTRGPWDPGALHGGAPAALFAHSLERADLAPGLQLARLTCEFLRPVPLAPLRVAVTPLRPGRRVSWLDATLSDGEHVVARARALMLPPAELGRADATPPPFPGPEEGRTNDFSRASGTGGRPAFATHAMEIRFVEGRFGEPGPATAWFRLGRPVIAGEALSPLARAAAAGDFGNGIASELSWSEHVFINPDLTLYFERPPAGEWVALQSRMRVGPGAVASAESVLWDERGRIGHATQALLVGAR